MRVLLLGEFSSLHRYLKEGLEAVGTETVLLSNGDSWKKIGGAHDSLYRNDGRGLTKLYRMNVEPFLNLSKFNGFDVIQLINTYTFYPTINEAMISIIRRKCHCLSLCSAGYDTRLYEKYKSGAFEYYQMDNATSVVDSFDKRKLKGKIHAWNDRRVEVLSDVVIPSCYEYYIGYQDSNKVSIVIPFPINVESIEYTPNLRKNKVVFFHGINREIEKGTPFIREALDLLKKKYPNDVEVIIEGHMPFDKYTEVMRRANVVIDQCKAYSYGINACIALASGKVVLSGCRKEHLESIGVNDCPILGVKPDVNQIFSQLDFIMQNKDSLLLMGESGRKYVESVHDHRKIAKMYLDVWCNVLKKSSRRE